MFRKPITEALLVFAAATAVVAGLWQLSRFVPFVAGNLHALVAVVFLLAPALVAWRQGKDLYAYGLRFDGWRKDLAFGLGAPLVIFPLFLLVFVFFYDWICGLDRDALLRNAAIPGFCPRFLGWEALASPRVPASFLSLLATQLIVVALPEELFFRGYLHQRLEEALPPRRRFLGGGLGGALVLSSLLFALGHVLVDFDFRRLAVFFPGLLFGWMRSATGSIVAPLLCHALSNLYIDVLQRTFFG